MSPDKARRGMSPAKDAGNPSSWRGGPWETPRTQQTKNPRIPPGKPGSSKLALNLITALIVKSCPVLVAGQAATATGWNGGAKPRLDGIKGPEHHLKLHVGHMPRRWTERAGQGVRLPWQR